MTYSSLDTILKTVLPDHVWKWKAPRGETRYIVWAPAGSHSEHGNNKRQLSALQATVYIYSQTEDDTLPDDVCAALDTAGIAYADPDPSYDDEACAALWIIECEVP
ncbi:MAG: hypothetical protein EOM54_05645 [Clostridia bacterium]|nr:hypothetical protein [Clostridia bacterium]